MAANRKISELQRLATLVRYYSLVSSSRAGSGHPTSSLSATDLMVGLMFGGFLRYNAEQPSFPNNDRLIFSKGHASPLLYALWTAAGRITEEELMTYRVFGSRLEGHPTVRFPYVDAATGSLGQGLGIGVGMALNAKYLDKLPYKTYVLLGDSEMSEGSQWEAIEIAAYYGLNNLVGIIDVNRLGQRGETMYGWDIEAYKSRIAPFGWKTITIDGHDFNQILSAYETAQTSETPVMIIAKTIKGKGVPFLENENGWHGKAITQDRLDEALSALGSVDIHARGELATPEDIQPQRRPEERVNPPHYDKEKPVATRKAYGNALARLYPHFPDIVALDGEVSNSTYAEIFHDAFPDRFFEMFIAEQNMVTVALGLQARGRIPFVSTFAAFFSRAWDQIRMCQYSDANIKFVGSHAGVAIGEDGPSQMGLSDIAMFRNVIGGVVLYPADVYSAEKLVEQAASHDGIVYIRTNRNTSPVIYSADDDFPIGGNKVIRRGDGDRAAIIAAGMTLFEALKAHDELQKQGISIRVIDLYCIKPIDAGVLRQALGGVEQVITVEDHHAEGGIGEAVRTALAEGGRKDRLFIHSLAVRKIPRSGKPAELFEFEEISAQAIVKKVKELL